MIIGISGKIGSGKDAAAIIIQRLDPDSQWENKKYAGKLKKIASILTGVPVNKFEDREFKQGIMSSEWKVRRWDEDFESAPTYREFLQRLGTEAIRDNIHPNTWVNALMADYVEKSYLTPGAKRGFYRGNHSGSLTNLVETRLPNWIITDVRFPNEADAIIKRGGVMIRINRGPESSGHHPSETALDDYGSFEYIIDNNGSMEDLSVALNDILSDIKNEYLKP